jgi:hypothetical protein
MKLLRPPVDSRRRGAALLLAFLVLIVILMIVYQIIRTTGNDQIETAKNLHLTSMEMAIDSAFLQVAEDLKADGEAAAAGAEEAGLGEGSGVEPGAALGAEGADGDEGAAGQAVDSQMDEWAQPSTTTINERGLRILIQDEDSKFNILGMLSEDEEAAQVAIDIVTRILDLCRDGTEADIGQGEAAEMARAMHAHLLERSTSPLPRPRLLTDDPEAPDSFGMPVTLREFVVLEAFNEQHFQDFFDSDGMRVHSIGSFLTIHSAPVIADGAPTGGFQVNVNTAPLAVLTGLFDTGDIDGRVWSEILAYRNEPEEEDPDAEEVEPMLDEFGNEIVSKQFFDDLDELEEVRGWEALDAVVKDPALERLTVQSHVFSVFITSRVSTAAEANQQVEFQTRREREEYERTGTHLVRTVRRIYWRQAVDAEVTMIPLLNWEVLDYAPLEVLDVDDDYY